MKLWLLVLVALTAGCAARADRKPYEIRSIRLRDMDGLCWLLTVSTTGAWELREAPRLCDPIPNPFLPPAQKPS